MTMPHIRSNTTYLIQIPSMSRTQNYPLIPKKKFINCRQKVILDHSFQASS